MHPALKWETALVVCAVQFCFTLDTAAGAEAGQSAWKIDEHPVLSPGIPGEWDDWAIASPTVLKLQSKWWVLYEGAIFDTAGVRSAFGTAESADKLTWHKHSQNPLFTPKLGEFQTCSSPCATRWRDAFWMVYIVREDPVHAAFAEHTPGSAMVKARCAQSEDGLIWHDLATAEVPISSDSPQAFEPCLYADGDRLHLWWLGPDSTGNRALLHSISSDGLAWSKPNTQPVKEFDARDICCARVYPSGDYYILTYVAMEDENKSSKTSFAVVTKTSRNARSWSAEGPPEFHPPSDGPPGAPWMTFESEGARLFWPEKQRNNTYRLSSAFCEKKYYASH